MDLGKTWKTPETDGRSRTDGGLMEEESRILKQQIVDFFANQDGFFSPWGRALRPRTCDS
jgi:hypothetical protein